MNKPTIPGSLRTLCALGLSIGALQTTSLGQGCVAARGAGNLCHPPISPYEFDATATPAHTDGKGKVMIEPTIDESRFRVSLGYRWLYSDRHFSGNNEQRHRDEEGSSVVNNSHYFDLGIEYRFNDRFSLSLTVPFSYHQRSSSVRNEDDKPIFRYTVDSGGLGDLALVGNYWIFDPKTHPDGNILLGIGVDFPTGEDDQSDTHYRRNEDTNEIESFTRHVDQSVQPSDGGWGAIVQLYGYQRLNDRLNLYAQGSYTITPEEDNGVTTGRSSEFEAIMGIADSYMARAGVDYVLSPKWGLVASVGARIEGVMVRDLIGGSDHFRRPGFAISVEPSVSWSYKDWTASLAVPVAVYRNRQRSVPDEQESEATGEWDHGDAAFADFQILFSMSKKF